MPSVSGIDVDASVSSIGAFSMPFDPLGSGIDAVVRVRRAFLHVPGASGIGFDPFGTHRKDSDTETTTASSLPHAVSTMLDAFPPLPDGLNAAPECSMSVPTAVIRVLVPPIRVPVASVGVPDPPTLLHRRLGPMPKASGRMPDAMSTMRVGVERPLSGLAQRARAPSTLLSALGMRSTSRVPGVSAHGGADASTD